MAGKLFDLTQFQRHRIGRQRLPAPGIFCHRRVTKLPIQSKVRAAEPSKAARAKITWLAAPLELENSVVIICGHRVWQFHLLLTGVHHVVRRFGPKLSRTKRATLGCKDGTFSFFGIQRADQRTDIPNVRMGPKQRFHRLNRSQEWALDWRRTRRAAPSP